MERYWISGVQLGLLVAANRPDREKIVDGIIDKQFVSSNRAGE